MVQLICLNYATIAEWLPLVVVKRPYRSAVVPVEIAENHSVNPFLLRVKKIQAFDERPAIAEQFVIGYGHS